MIQYLDTKSKMVMDAVDKMIPITADAEINYALKKYYLASEFDEAEVERIIKKREEELKIMMEQLILTSFEELDKPIEPVEETKSMDMIREDVETNTNTNVQGHENDKLVDGTNSVDTTERGHEE